MPYRNIRVDGRGIVETDPINAPKVHRIFAYATKSTELRDRVATLTLQAAALDRSHHEDADIAIKAFELSQSLTAKLLTSDYPAKRRILEIICLNFRFDDVTLYPVMRKPFDVLVEGLISQKSR